jgi:hypothetical protein
MALDARKIFSSLAPGLLVALPALPSLYEASVRASWATLGRDQGIFQYTAWAVANGARAYRDVRDVNGPLVIMMHGFLQALGGSDEHVFRTLDLLLVGASAAFLGACLVALEKRPNVLRAATLAIASWVIVSTQYIAYGFWDTAQRESFFDLFLLVSIGAQLLRRDRLLLLAGALSIAPWFGKPTYALFTIVQLLTLASEGPSRVRRIATFLAGGAIGAAVPLAWLALRGDVGAWARITFVDVPAMYRFIWPRTPAGIYALHRDAISLALLTSGALLALIVSGRMSRRALPIALMPLCGLASVLVQAKGFLYHMHPVTLGSHLALLALVHHAWTEVERVPSLISRVFAAAFALGLGARTAMWASRASTFYLPPPADAADLASDDRLARYTRIDFFPVAMRRASELLARETRPEDTVQVYGMDPYLLFNARRRSATPYIYSYDLDADAALAGSFEEGGLRPTPDQIARIREIRDAHERDLVERLERAPPAAFVFIGKAPLMVQPDALADFEDHCPEAAAWMHLHYRERATFNEVRVFTPASPLDP